MYGKISITFILISILFVGFVFVVTSCAEWPGKYAPPKLVKMPKPNPLDDFIKLRELFKTLGGNLVTQDDVIVRWKDTDIFRMFEFKHHTVVVFPYNWTSKKFDLILFAGHIKNYGNIFDSIYYKYKPNHETKIYFYNETMNLNPVEVHINEVGIGGFYFGEDRNNIIIKQSRLIEANWSREEQQKKLQLECLTSQSNHAWGSNNDIDFRLLFESGKISYINFYPRGVPQLNGYSIKEPKMPVLAEGEFAIPSQK